MGYQEDVVASLDLLAKQEGKCNVLAFLATQWQAEQANYWTRFAGFAALHVGLFVCANSDYLGWNIFICAVGVCMAGLWIGVQIRSKYYVERWKHPFHAYRWATNTLWLHDKPTSTLTNKIFASTSIALLAPFLVLLVWGAATCLLLIQVPFWAARQF